MKTQFYFTMILLTILGACGSKLPADLIVHHAKVYTVDSAFSVVEAIAVKEGRIIAVGSNDEILGAYEAKEMLDAEGRFVYPGFIDAHCHFFAYGLHKMHASLQGTKSFVEVLERLKEHAVQYKPDWILGRGWDQNDWVLKEFPDNQALDSLFPDVPVFITRIDGHAALANTKALELAGITATTRIDGGEIRIKNGKLTGLLIDNAMSLVTAIVPQPDTKEKSQALLSAQQDCFAAGLTSVADAGLDRDDILLMDSLQKDGQLSMRIYAMLNPTVENYEQFLYKGIYATDHLNVRSIKTYADGALGSRGACLKQPYSDDPGNTGLMVEPYDRLKDICLRAWNHGYQVNIHAIGDSAVHTVLEMYASILSGPNDRRWRIEHAQVVDIADISLFREYSVVPSVQPTHATSDMYWAQERLGRTRIKMAYAYLALLKQNGWLAFGTDFPIEEISPLLTFYAAVTRMNTNAWPEGGWQMENALNREDALRAMTLWAARACFEEQQKGSIEKGKWADFVILDTDLMEAPTQKIPLTKVLKTYSGGALVYDSK